MVSHDFTQRRERSMSQPTTSASKHRNGVAGPSIFWLAAGFLLAGLGTVMLGPIMPTLLHDWRLTDQQGGLLPAAKFVGAFLGGMLVPRRLRFGVLGGMAFAGAGFGAFALSGDLLSGVVCLFVSGFGLGQIIASTNIVVGRRYREHTGSALASVNFFWSLGAIACGLIAAAALPRFHLRGPLLTFAGFFLVTGMGGLLNLSQDAANEMEPPTADAESLPARALIRFAVLLFLYGGLETCMTGWLTTYTLRFSDVRLLGGQSAIVLLWSALTVGRAISSAALRGMREATLQRIGLGLSAVWIAALALVLLLSMMTESAMPGPSAA
jgi:fucose permease